MMRRRSTVAGFFTALLYGFGTQDAKAMESIDASAYRCYLASNDGRFARHRSVISTSQGGRHGLGASHAVRYE
ncbi:hypothetical protein CSPX01_14417 [Colletotrichum filicis]|nr:hypothetical protein CSPX01_14417 [Colletotrichum filicis]